MEGHKDNCEKCPHGFYVGDGCYCDLCASKDKGQEVAQDGGE